MSRNPPWTPPLADGKNKQRSFISRIHGVKIPGDEAVGILTRRRSPMPDQGAVCRRRSASMKNGPRRGRSAAAADENVNHQSQQYRLRRTTSCGISSARSGKQRLPSPALRRISETAEPIRIRRTAMRAVEVKEGDLSPPRGRGAALLEKRSGPKGLGPGSHRQLPGHAVTLTVESATGRTSCPHSQGRMSHRKPNWAGRKEAA